MIKLFVLWIMLPITGIITVTAIFENIVRAVFFVEFARILEVNIGTAWIFATVLEEKVTNFDNMIC